MRKILEKVANKNVEIDFQNHFFHKKIHFHTTPESHFQYGNGIWEADMVFGGPIFWWL